MKIYNSLSHKKEDFIPIKDKNVSMYTCGPTVYHYAHIGNLRTYIMEDILEKYLTFTGYNVKRVMNITDVGHLTSDGDTGDDKMLNGAKREHKSVMEIAKYYTDAFLADCEKLNIKIPDIVAPATSYIDKFIKVISKLIDTGYAYQAGGNVYFDTSKLENYYVFNNFNSDDLAVGVREGVEEDSNKRNKADFVLWFTKSKFEDQELKWESPWGLGYPGWHIECSSISMENLGEYLDIHCGGIDNVFPHHTNEIAQCEAYLGHKWCNYWFHVHHLNTAEGKMSKSKGEFLTVSLLEDKGYDPMVYRFLCLQSHYRKTLTFSWDILDNAKKSYNSLVGRIADLIRQTKKQINIETILDTDNKKAEEHIEVQKARRMYISFLVAMEDDLNTSLAITSLFDTLKMDVRPGIKLALIEDFDNVLGLSLIDRAKKLVNSENIDDIPENIKKLVEERQEARKHKNYKRADELRNEIDKLGYKVAETRDGVVISKK